MTHLFKTSILFFALFIAACSKDVTTVRDKGRVSDLQETEKSETTVVAPEYVEEDSLINNALANGNKPKSSLSADLVLRDGAIYTLNPEQSWASALAVYNRKIIYVGGDVGVAGFIGEGTNVIELNGAMVLPGLHDSHVHALSSQLRRSEGLVIEIHETAEEAIAKISDYIANNPDKTIILGGTLGLDEELPRDILDQIDNIRPIIIAEESGHAAWVNSAALDAAGITDDTPSPQGGKIVRDENGRATGFLIDTAREPLRPLINSARENPSGEDRLIAARRVQKWFNSFGITSIKELHGGRDHLDTYKALMDVGELTIRVSQHFTYRPRTPDEISATDEFLKARHHYRSDQLNPDFIKLNMDGVPGTLFMLENYPGNNNQPLIDPEKLKELLIKFDAMGMTVAVHAHGDAAIRSVLDAVEAARQANGDSGIIHQNAHTSLPHADDLRRFAELNVVAEISPHTWYPGQTHDWVKTVMPNDLLQSLFPARSFVDAGATLATGSDWASNTATVNPFPAMEALITRKDPYGERPDERYGTIAGLTVAEVIAAYTIGGAHAANRADDLGSIEVGKRADLAVLNQNLFEIPVEDISETKVLYTFLDGKLVFQPKEK